MGFDSGLTSVTGNVLSLPKTLTLTPLTGRQVNTGTYTLGTVGAGKKWSILKIVLSCSQGSTIGQTDIVINGVSYLALAPLGSATVITNATASIEFEYGQCPLITVGQTIQMVIATSTVYSTYTVIYAEETA